MILIFFVVLLLNGWHRIGPGGGGAQFSPTVSPHDWKHAAVTCDMSGSYVTRDGGESWHMFNLHDQARFFVFDPHDPATIYASSASLMRSTDSGLSWKMLYPDPAAVTSVVMETDDAGERYVTRAGNASSVSALGFGRYDARVLYAGMDKSLRVSNDGGKTWRILRELPWPARAIIVDEKRDIFDGNVDIYVVGPDRVVARGNGQWADFGPPAGIREFRDVSTAGRVIFATARRASGPDALLRSGDGGATWRDLTSRLPSAEFLSIGVSSGHPEWVYVAAAGTGIWQSHDGGENWKMVLGDGAHVANRADDWVNETHHGWGGPAHGLGVSPQDGRVCYATDDGRTLRTINGGESWQAVYSRAAGGAGGQAGSGHTSRGLDVTTCYGVHFDPFHASRMFITYTDIGLFRSDDGGASWQASSAGVPTKWSNTAYWMLFDPQVAGRAWMAASGTHDLPRPRMWRRRSPLEYKGGVMISADGGVTWKESNRGMPEAAVTHLLLDPRSNVQSRTLYAATMGRGVYKSVDGGASWIAKNHGLAASSADGQILAWRLTLGDALGGAQGSTLGGPRGSDATLYLVVARRREDGKIGGDRDGAVYRSIDGGENWQPIALPAGTNGPTGISLAGNRLLLSAWGRSHDETTTGGGIFYSDDAAKTWTRANIDDQFIYDTTVDPRDPKIAYATGFSNTAWRTADAGRTWHAIAGYDFKAGHRVILDPKDASKIYVTTFGGGVWAGPKP